MIERIRLLGLTFALVFALSPVNAAAQESLNAAEQDYPTAIASPTDPSTGADVGSAETTQSLSSVSLESPSITRLQSASEQGSIAETLQLGEENTPASPAAAGKGSGTGLGFMIAGAAALVGGLLIGGTGGNLIAAGGVALGVYGIIVYF